MPADFVAYYIKKFLRQPNASLARQYLGISDGGGNFVLSNSNNVSFGSNGSVVTATATFAGGGGAAISAGASSQSTGTVIFSNLNGLTFGLNAATLTASHNGLTSQSNQAASASNGSFTFQTLGFSNANNVTFGTSAGSIITASVATAAPSPVNFSAGTTSNNLGSVVFDDANGISFGLNGSTITASHNGLTSQSNQAFSASGGSSAFQTLVFNPANGATFSNNAGSVELSYTVPSTAGLISAINISACTTSNNLTAVTFSNANGITFGLDASTITASHNGLTSQSAQAASASNGSFAFQTIAFSDANNVTFGTSAGSIITASINAGLTSQSSQVASASNGSFAFETIAFSNANNVTFGTSAGSIITASVNAAGGGATISAFDQNKIQGSVAAWNNATFSNRPFFIPFVLPAAISAVNSINIYVSRTAGTSALASLHAGIYTVANQTSMNLVSSTSFAVSMTTSSLFSSVRLLEFTGLGALSLSAGQYVLGINASIAGTNSWAMMMMGVTQANIVGVIHPGTNSSAATASDSHFLPFWGVFNATSSALPSAVGASSISGGATINSPNIYFALKAIAG